jgi:glycosyltransferase involved in cell wall biosynthesis
VVATRVGGIPEIVSHEESALLVEPRDCEGMAAAIATVLTNPALATRLTDRAYQLVVARHAPKLRAQRLQQIYASMLR